MTTASGRIIESRDIGEYFRSSVQSALERQRIAACPATVCYLVNVLAGFARAEQLFDQHDNGSGIPPLASLYGAAIEARSREQRTRSLQRLGDIALFIAGVFADSLNRKLVDIDYYIAMGGNAYGYLADDHLGSRFTHTPAAVFSELAARFAQFVDVLAEVGDQGRINTDADIMRLYEIWLRSGSPRALGKLTALGISVAAGNVSLRRH